MPKKDVRRILFAAMMISRCDHCGAELLPETNFCRQCGTSLPANIAAFSSELPTVILSRTPDGASTRRLDPRHTSGDRRLVSNAPANKETPGMPVGSRGRRGALIAGLALLLIPVGIISSLAFIRLRSHGPTTLNSNLFYPDAQIILDLATDAGRSLQLRTEDSFDRVVAWYQTSLKPTKTVRVTSSIVVLQNEEVTATITTEDNKTIILIKQSAP